jgi:hypothetical protein
MKDDFKNEDPSLYYFANGLINYQKDDLNFVKLSEWEEKLDRYRFELYNPTRLVQSFWTYLEHEWFFIGFMSTFILFASLIFRSKVIFLFFLLFLIALILSPFYLLKVQVYAILFLTLFSACFVIPKNSFRGNPKLLYLLVFFLISGLLIHFKAFFESKANLISSEVLVNRIIDLKQAGYERIYLIGSGEILRDFRFTEKLPFKVLGWPTLLEKSNDSLYPSKIAYLVDERTFNFNPGYFEGFSRPTLIMEDFILVTKK